MNPEVKAKKERYIDCGGIRCLNCEQHTITGDQVTVTGGGAIQDISCLNCGSTWTDYYKLDTAVSIEIHNEHLQKEVPDGLDKNKTS